MGNNDLLEIPAFLRKKGCKPLSLYERVTSRNKLVKVPSRSDVTSEIASFPNDPDLVVQMWDDGWRLVVITKKGIKWVHVLDCGTLKVRKVPKDQLRHTRPPFFDTSHARVAALIGRQRDAFKRTGSPYSKSGAIRAVALLTGGRVSEEDELLPPNKSKIRKWFI